MKIAINKHSRQWAHSEKDTYDSTRLHMYLVLAKTYLFTCLSNNMLWDQICPQQHAEQSIRLLLVPCKKLLSKEGVHDFGKTKRKATFFFFYQDCKLQD